MFHIRFLLVRLSQQFQRHLNLEVRRVGVRTEKQLPSHLCGLSHIFLVGDSQRNFAQLHLFEALATSGANFLLFSKPTLHASDRNVNIFVEVHLPDRSGRVVAAVLCGQHADDAIDIVTDQNVLADWIDELKKSPR